MDASQNEDNLMARKYRYHSARNMTIGPMPMLPNWQYYLNMPDEDPHIFNMSSLLEIHKTLDCQVLAEVTDALLNQHDSLRVRLFRTPNGWQARVAEGEQATPFSQIDLSHMDPERQKEVIEAEIEKLQGTLNLSEGPLIRVVYFYLGDNQPGRLLFIVHHFATNEYSQAILLEDFFTAYEQLRQGLSLHLPATTSSIKQYAERLLAYAQSDAMQEIDYWVTKERMQAVPLPMDYPEGLSAPMVRNSVLMQLGKEETEGLLSLSKRGMSMRDILLAALYKTYNIWTKQKIMLVDYIYHGRITNFKDISLLRTVGHIDCMVPLLISVDPPFQLGDVVGIIQNLMKQQPNYGMGYHILRYLGNEEMRSLFESLPWPQLHLDYYGKISHNDQPLSWVNPAEEHIRGWQSTRRIDSLGVWLFAGIKEGILRTQWDYHTKVYSRDTIQNLAQNFLMELRNI